jgi:hypothetical protein
VLVGGYLLNAWEQFHYDGLLLTFQHAMAAGSLKSTVLIPTAFRDWGHWTYWTDLAARNRYCDKANGVATTLPPGVEYATIIKRIKIGDFVSPDDPGGPAPQPLPHPFSIGLAYKVELQKVSKGAEKVGKDEDD